MFYRYNRLWSANAKTEQGTVPANLLAKAKKENHTLSRWTAPADS